jgi:hypothetical protein
MTNITFGDCSCLYKKEKDIISESLRDNLNKIESHIRKEQSKRKQDPPFIKYLKDMHMSVQELKDKVNITVICGY